jgi:hypothetical protein
MKYFFTICIFSPLIILVIPLLKAILFNFLKVSFFWWGARKNRPCIGVGPCIK